MALLTPEEVEHARFHLGYGNLQVGAYPWTPDGFFELWTNVIAVWLSDGWVTSATTTIGATGLPVSAVVTPAAMSGTLANGLTSAIAVGQRLIVDVDDDAEILVVKAITSTTFTAKFQVAHDVTGYPIAVESGTSRLRYLLHRADRVHEAMFSGLTTVQAGLSSADKGEVVWIGQNSVLKGQYAQYQVIVDQMSSLCRVDQVRKGGGPATRVEVY